MPVLGEPDPKATVASPLFRLPLEIRQQIYGYLLDGKLRHISAIEVAINFDEASWRTAELSTWEERRNRIKVAILSVSRLINHESTPILYRKTVFDFECGSDLRYIVSGRPLYSELSRYIRRACFRINNSGEHEKIWLRQLRGCCADSECDLQHAAGFALKNQLPALEVLELEFATNDRAGINRRINTTGSVHKSHAEVFAETIAVLREEVVGLQMLVVIGIDDEAVELEMRKAMTRPTGTEKINGKCQYWSCR